MMEKFHRIFTSNGWVTLNDGGKEKEMTKLEKYIKDIADEIESERSSIVAIYAARYLLTNYDRRALPDWVEALANANDAVWEDVVDEVRRLKAAEEMEE